jgi:hypothetical protein
MELDRGRDGAWLRGVVCDLCEVPPRTIPAPGGGDRREGGRGVSEMQAAMEQRDRAQRGLEEAEAQVDRVMVQSCRALMAGGFTDLYSEDPRRLRAIATATETPGTRTKESE